MKHSVKHSVEVTARHVGTSSWLPTRVRLLGAGAASCWTHCVARRFRGLLPGTTAATCSAGGILRIHLVGKGLTYMHGRVSHPWDACVGEFCLRARTSLAGREPIRGLFCPLGGAVPCCAVSAAVAAAASNPVLGRVGRRLVSGGRACCQVYGPAACFFKAHSLCVYLYLFVHMHVCMRVVADASHGANVLYAVPRSLAGPATARAITGAPVSMLYASAVASGAVQHLKVKEGGQGEGQNWDEGWARSVREKGSWVVGTSQERGVARVANRSGACPLRQILLCGRGRAGGVRQRGCVHRVLGAGRGVGRCLLESPVQMPA